MQFSSSEFSEIRLPLFHTLPPAHPAGVEHDFSLAMTPLPRAICRSTRKRHFSIDTVLACSKLNALTREEPADLAPKTSSIIANSTLCGVVEEAVVRVHQLSFQLHLLNARLVVWVAIIID